MNDSWEDFDQKIFLFCKHDPSRTSIISLERFFSLLDQLNGLILLRENLYTWCVFQTTAGVDEKREEMRESKNEGGKKGRVEENWKEGQERCRPWEKEKGDGLT